MKFFKNVKIICLILFCNILFNNFNISCNKANSDNFFNEYELELLKSLNINVHQNDTYVDEFMKSLNIQENNISNNKNKENSNLSSNLIYVTTCYKNNELYDLSCSFLRDSPNEFNQCISEFIINCCEIETKMDIKSKDYSLIKDKYGKILIQNSLKRSIIMNVQKLIKKETLINSNDLKTKISLESSMLKQRFDNFKTCVNKANTSIISDTDVFSKNDKKENKIIEVNKDHMNNLHNSLIINNSTNISSLKNGNSTFNIININSIDVNQNNSDNTKLNMRFKQKNSGKIVKNLESKFESSICDSFIEENDYSRIKDYCLEELYLNENIKTDKNSNSICIISVCQKCCDSYNTSKFYFY